MQQGAVSNPQEVGNVFSEVDLPHFHELIFYIEESASLFCKLFMI